MPIIIIAKYVPTYILPISWGRFGYGISMIASETADHNIFKHTHILFVYIGTLRLCHFTGRHAHLIKVQKLSNCTKSLCTADIVRCLGRVLLYEWVLNLCASLNKVSSKTIEI